MNVNGNNEYKRVERSEMRSEEKQNHSRQKTKTKRQHQPVNSALHSFLVKNCSNCCSKRSMGERSEKRSQKNKTTPEKKTKGKQYKPENSALHSFPVKQYQLLLQQSIDLQLLLVYSQKKWLRDQKSEAKRSEENKNRRKKT